ncbi:hypothetical protein DRE_05965 [Drechslerella stenobrocha 248]|uniref:RING-type domain-containing protein n=1 Tax=Drechslerella stenobrocha 248 TaxID=1043628 RepID=W7HZ52_9PEZI|nr:hypothetical protein DRE_05965 [Drechslerella stenobrocha 248]
METTLPAILPATATPSLTFSPIPTPSSSPSSGGGGGGGGGGSQNSPLLFFVALGFGVVFTNLWIIVGVKYCFRYNARNRARANGVDEVDLQAIGTRPHRRRREKKLMTVDEVNERFPVTKYKTWRANREVMGLPTAGGIASTDGTTPVSTTETHEAEIDPLASPLPKIPEPVADPSKPVPSPTSQVPESTTDRTEIQATAPTPAPTTALTTAPTTTTATTAAPATRSSTEIRRVPSQHSTDPEDHDDDEPMPALPVDMANSCGDTCAICIDNLEDSDDVRGLTCGHAFHTACIDPWLTVRRACCPLCKADYYVPKPRTEAEIEAEEAARERRRQQVADMHRHPLSSWWMRAEAFLMPPGPATGNRSRRAQADARRHSQAPSSRWNPLSRRSNTANNDPIAGSGLEVQQSDNSSPSFFARFGRAGRSENGANPSAAVMTENPTPSALEAGLANSNPTSGPR